MGYYIETGSRSDKSRWLVKNHQAEILQDLAAARLAQSAGKGVVVVLDNGMFEAAGFAFSPEELDALGVITPGDIRRRTFVAMDLAKAKELSGYIDG